MECIKSCAKEKTWFLHENGLKCRSRNLPENLKPEFKPMTENFQEKLQQWSVNNQKVQKFMSVLELNLGVKNSPKLCAKCKTFQELWNDF